MSREAESCVIQRLLEILTNICKLYFYHKYKVTPMSVCVCVYIYIYIYDSLWTAHADSLADLRWIIKKSILLFTIHCLIVFYFVYKGDVSFGLDHHKIFLVFKIYIYIYICVCVCVCVNIFFSTYDFWYIIRLKY